MSIVKKTEQLIEMLRLRLGAVGVRSTADSDARMHWIGYWVVASGY